MYGSFYMFVEMYEDENMKLDFFENIFLRRFDMNMIYKPRNSNVELFARTFVCETYYILCGKFCFSTYIKKMFIL